MSSLAKFRGQRVSSRFLNTSLLLWFYSSLDEGITKAWVDIVITDNSTLGHQNTSHRKGLGSSDYGPTNTNPNVVDYIGRQGCHHLGLPQLSVGLAATLVNCKTKHYA